MQNYLQQISVHHIIEKAEIEDNTIKHSYLKVFKALCKISSKENSALKTALTLQEHEGALGKLSVMDPEP